MDKVLLRFPGDFDYNGEFHFRRYIWEKAIVISDTKISLLMSQNDAATQEAPHAHKRIDALEKKLKSFEERLGKLEKKKKA